MANKPKISVVIPIYNVSKYLEECVRSAMNQTFKDIEIIIIGFCLASDAFAVSLCKGFSFNKISFKKAIVVAIYFAFFQGLMTYLGFNLGSYFGSSFIIFEHIISFILLFLIGLT